MVNSSGLLEFEFAATREPVSLQPANAQRIADPAVTIAQRPQKCLRPIMEGFSSPPLLSAARLLSYMMRGLGGKQAEPTGNCVRHRGNPTGSRRRVCRHTRRSEEHTSELQSHVNLV